MPDDATTASPHREAGPAAPGTVWRCPDGHLWTVDTACGTCRRLGKGEGGARHVHTPGHAWWPANRWQRLLATLRGNQRPILAAAISMANHNRTPRTPTGAPTGAPPLPDYNG